MDATAAKMFLFLVIISWPFYVFKSCDTLADLWIEFAILVSVKSLRINLIAVTRTRIGYHAGIMQLKLSHIIYFYVGTTNCFLWQESDDA